MSEESDATTTYPEIEIFENNEAEDNENNHDIYNIYIYIYIYIYNTYNV